MERPTSADTERSTGERVMARYIIITPVAVALLGATLLACASQDGEGSTGGWSEVCTTLHRVSEVMAVLAGVGVVLGVLFALASIFICLVIIISVLEMVFRPQIAVLGVRPRFARMIFGSLGEKYSGLR